MPSPTIATRRPSACSRMISAAFASGSTSEITLSTPTAAPTVRAVRSLSPVSNVTVSPRSWNAATASTEVGLIVSATTNTTSARPPRPAKTAVFPARSAAAPARSISTGTDSNSCRRPTRTSTPSTLAATPTPGRLTKPSTGPGSEWRSAAAAAMDCAIGCSERTSTAPANPRSSSASSSDDPSGTITSTSAMRPSVTVPVLSSTIVSIRRVSSRTSPPLMITPSCAARPVPTMMPSGVASPSAHGHAMISTATDAVNASLASPAMVSQATSVTTAMTIAVGTNTAATRSARRWTSARLP